MEVWHEALKVALIGTERQAPAFTLSEEPVSSLLAQLNADERERTLLRASGLIAAYRRAGFRPSQSEEALPIPVEEEEKSPVPDSVIQDLLVMLGGEYREALPEWLATAAERGWRVPQAHLVELLDFGRGHPENRDAILPLLGKRGRWLAEQNPDWKYALQFSLFEIEHGPESDTLAAENVEPIWQTGTREERVALLLRLRLSTPAQARSLVESTWKQDASAERAEFVTTLATGLSLEDEPFLENALDDKRKEVRAAAQELLMRLPESRLCRRMWDRVRSLVQLQTVEVEKAKPEASGGLWKRVCALLTPPSAPAPSETLVVALPPVCDKAMIRDGIEVKSPYTNVGEKTWWLTQMLACVPLTLWNKEWDRTPASLITANRSEEWQQTLLTAWTKALRREKDPTWAAALFTFWCETLPEQMPLDSLWSEILPEPILEAGLLHLLDRTGQQIQYGNPAFTLLAQQKTVWSATLTRAVLAKLTAFTGNSYHVAGMMTACAPQIPSPFRAEFFALWSKLAENNTYLQGQINRSIALDAFSIEMRRKLIAAEQEN